MRSLGGRLLTVFQQRLVSVPSSLQSLDPQSVDPHKKKTPLPVISVVPMQGFSFHSASEQAGKRQMGGKPYRATFFLGGGGWKCFVERGLQDQFWRP